MGYCMVSTTATIVGENCFVLTTKNYARHATDSFFSKQDCEFRKLIYGSRIDRGDAVVCDIAVVGTVDLRLSYVVGE